MCACVYRRICMMDRLVFGGLCQLGCVYIGTARGHFFDFFGNFTGYTCTYTCVRARTMNAVIARFHRLTFIFILSKKRDTRTLIHVHTHTNINTRVRSRLSVFVKSFSSFPSTLAAAPPSSRPLLATTDQSNSPDTLALGANIYPSYLIHSRTRSSVSAHM